MASHNHLPLDEADGYELTTITTEINYASFHPIQHCDAPEGSRCVLLTMLCKSSRGLFLKILRALADVPAGWGILAV